MSAVGSLEMIVQFRENVILKLHIVKSALSTRHIRNPETGWTEKGEMSTGIIMVNVCEAPPLYCCDKRPCASPPHCVQVENPWG